ncbi:hypothetical protein [Corynebacterium sp.]|uniref:hypothetical protein n=1 Tax=Corynebacterium sp. TaxID=1720 RepID=UPI0026DC29F2|nr:hypothetical protein [Corynebacterium sp.]MDO5031684.1 hypothetical protein [Corynebacterium sp.]
MIFSANQRRIFALCVALSAAVLLIMTLKLPGLFIAILVAWAMWLLATSRPDQSEHTALRTSIALTVEDITDILSQYEAFISSEDPDNLADRTLHRPALADADCTEPAIAAFHYEAHGAERFLRRLSARLHRSDIETKELESLLKIADERADQLKESWLAARRVAKTLGPGYSKD